VTCRGNKDGQVVQEIFRTFVSAILRLGLCVPSLLLLEAVPGHRAIVPAPADITGTRGGPKVQRSAFGPVRSSSVIPVSEDEPNVLTPFLVNAT
jgi:hypothetical protein